MKAKAKFLKDGKEYWGVIGIEHPLLISGGMLLTVNSQKKGELRRKVIQFCAALNLDLEWI
jgi:hypothetical protein